MILLEITSPITMQKVIIQKVHVDTIDSTKINDANLPKDIDDLEAQSKDKETELRKTYLDKYVTIMDYPVKFTHSFTSVEMDILKSSCEISMMTGVWPKLFGEELDLIMDKLKASWIDGEYFIRFSSGSPKDGEGEYPIKDPKTLMKMLLTSARAYFAFSNGFNKLYFIEFNPEFDVERELRVFVKNRRIMCVSQYNWYKPGYFSKLSDDVLVRIINTIQTEVDIVTTKLCDTLGTNDLTIDFLVREDQSVKFIEVNSFGYWMNAGGCLFSWNTDRDILYDKMNEHNIYFRICTN